MASQQLNILLIIEHGGIPVYPKDLSDRGYDVDTATNMRQALARVKTSPPDIIIAEFNFVSTFRDRISNLESLLARLQTTEADTRVIVAYDTAHIDHLERLRERFSIFEALRYPLDAATLFKSIERAIQ